MYRIILLLFVGLICLQGQEEPPYVRPNPVLVAHADISGDGELDYIWEIRNDNEFALFWSYQIETDKMEFSLFFPDTIYPQWETLRDINQDTLPDVRVIVTGSEVVWFSQVNTPDQIINWNAIRSSTAIDSDKDGLNLWEEAEAGTSDINSDTDGDTLSDGWEVFHGRDPLVSDSKYYNELRLRAFPTGEPAITIALDRTITLTNLYPADEIQIKVQISEDLLSWRTVASANDARFGILKFHSPLPTGYVRFALSE